MIVYRFSRERFSNDLSGEGALRFGGRWNNKGLPVIYTSLTISLSLLELLIHSAAYDQIVSNRLTIIEVPDKSLAEVSAGRLKKNWQSDENYSRFMGDQFLSTKTTLLLKVPSAIIPAESNILINPKHKDASKVKIHSIQKFSFDNRMFKTQSI